MDEIPKDLPYLPMRLTQHEWDELWSCYGSEAYHVFPRAAVYMDTVFEPGWDYTDRFTVRLRYNKHEYTFGPHRTDGLARQKALRFLVERKAIEILPEAT